MIAHSKDTVVLLNFLPSFDSSYSNKGAIYPAISILLIGSTLKKHGFNVKIIDGAYYENFIEILEDYINRHRDKILFVGMSVMTTQVPLALKASRAVKIIDKKIPVVWGGCHPTLFPEQTLKDVDVDIVSINEGALTTLRLAKVLQEGAEISSVNGIGYKNDNQEIIITTQVSLENIRDFPHFDFSLIEIDNYLSDTVSVYQREFPNFQHKVKIMPILTGLGCPYKCQFCVNVILKRRYRYRDAKSIVSEIMRLQEEYDANTFIFMDEDFFINKRRAFEFFDLVEEKGLHFNWRMWCRVDHFNDNYINRELLRRIDNIGYGSLVMGGESGNQAILDKLKKQTTPKQILNSLQSLERTKISPRYSFMIGLEDETLDQMRDTLDLCFKMKNIRPDVDIAPFIFRLYPGSPIYNRLVERHNIKLPRDLESWSKFLKESDSYTEMPWTPKVFQDNIKHIEFCMNFAMTPQRRVRGVKNVLRAILAKICRFRLKSFLFFMPVEYMLAQWFLNRRQQR